MSAFGNQKPPYNEQGARQCLDNILRDTAKLGLLLGEEPDDYNRTMALQAITTIVDSVWVVREYLKGYVKKSALDHA